MSIAEQEEDVVRDQLDLRSVGTPLTRRDTVAMGLALAGGTLTAGSVRPTSAAPLRQATPVAVLAIARDIMEQLAV